MRVSHSGNEAGSGAGGFFRGLREVLIILAIAIVVSFVIRTFFFRAFLIPSGSMEDTLQVNDRIFVNLIVDSEEQLERGDVVDRKSTRLNSSHVAISYAVFCLKKKKKKPKLILSTE